MAVLKMQRISICALKKDRKSILEKLQSLGVLEISHVLEEDEDFHKMERSARLYLRKLLRQRIRRLIFWINTRRRKNRCSRRWKERN